MFERTCTILDQSAQLADANKGNEVLAPYFEATTQSCAAAMDMIRTGTPQEAIGATKLSSTLHQTTQLVVAAVKGFGEGVKSSVSSVVEALRHPDDTLKHIGQGVGHALKFLLPRDGLTQQECEAIFKRIDAVSEAIEACSRLPLEQQVHTISSLIGSVAVESMVGATVAKGLQSVVKLTKVGFTGLKVAEPAITTAVKTGVKAERAVLEAERTAAQVGRTIAAAEKAAVKVEQTVVATERAVVGAEKVATVEGAAVKAGQVEQKVAREARELGRLSQAERVAQPSASNINAQKTLNKKLRGLEKAQMNAVKVEKLPDGRIRYYAKERLADTPGPTRGSSYVTEHNPRTGQTRSWIECYDSTGNVNRVHPKTLDGHDLIGQHYPPTRAELESFARNQKDL